MHDQEDLIALARAEYIAGRIEIEDFEAALEHIFAGGFGNADFPYLPMFRAPASDNTPR